MNWRFAAFKAALSGRSENLQQFFTSRMTSPPDRNTQEFLETYAHSPRLAPVTKIATDLSNVPGKLYRVDPATGDKDEINDHPFLNFMRRPNPLPFMTPSALWKVHETYLLMKGEGAAIIERDPAGYPSELWPVPPHWMIDIPRLDFPFYTIRSRDGLQMPVPAEDVFIVRQLNPLDPYGRGLGDAEAVADEIETDEYMAKWAKKFFYNDATPPVLMSAPGITKDEYDRFQAAWNDRHRGVGNAHKMGIIPRDVTVNKLVDSQREMDFTESRKDLRDGVNAHFGVPPEILGIVENSNRATATQAKIIYAENVLTPRLLARQDAINLQLLPAWGEGLLWEYDDIVPEDTEFRLEMSNAGLSGSALLVDEWREQQGFDPLPDDAGQVLFVPFASMPTKPSELTESPRTFDQLTPGTAPSDAPPGTLLTPQLTPGQKANRRRAQQAAHRMRAQLLAAEERAAQRSVRRFFNGQTAAIIDAMDTGQKDAKDDFWQKINGLGGLTVDIEAIRAAAKDALSQLIDWGAQDEALAAVLNPIWEDAFNMGAKSIEDSFGVRAVTAPKLTDYLRQSGLRRVKGINETTRDKLASTLADGIEAGESTAQLVKRMQQHLPDIQAERAAAIATSEAHTSMQAGSFAQMRFGGITTKTWITAGDEATRDSHRAQDGQTVPIDQPFRNGLMYPGDPSGAPGEIINCRCDMLPGEL